MPDPSSRSAAWLAALIALPVAVLAGIAAFALLGGFGPDDPAGSEPTGSPRPQATGPVPMAERALSEREETVCRALLSQLPEQIDELVQRPVTAGPEQNAAYGDPAVTVACGGPEPTYALTDTVYPLAGVCWHAAEEADGTVWTTLDREVPVRVSVPHGYEAPGQRVMEFSPTIVESVPSAGTVPAGCRP